MRWIRLLATCAFTATASLTASLAPMPAFGQTAPAAPLASTAGDVSFGHAVAAAIARSATGRAQAARLAEHRARRAAAESFTPAPPSFALSHFNDRSFHREGAREDEAEIAVPLWLPGVRSGAIGVAQAEADAFEAGAASARLKIAADVREAVWAVRLADADLQATTRRVAEMQALADDVQRRARAGDLARTDANQATAGVRLAEASQADAQSRRLRAQRLYTALTGFAQLPLAGERPPAAAPAIDAHPHWIAACRAVDAARSRLEQATRSTRDAPEVALMVKRERAGFDDRFATTLGIGLRIPFGTDARNQPRITAANAELIELEAVAALERDRLQAEIDASRAELDQAGRIEQLAAERARLAADTQQLLTKAFALGEIDLPNRLRAENERFDAELGLARARLEAGRAASRLLQAHGLLP